ncbi:CRISPR-associated protein Csm1 [Methanomicrobium sp. W14]|uniref:type III-A CRISPR-associated protein Cas10/Csm1 n=1 Tax=Methanomicrobium sp. W14 TaxID=2817839 RepID=UPI001AEADD15|nr:type III-A CRISPR-associated protein Cas10/Csm1 [Methanomicrobium sp. W14]MBP2132413.1 CRISPR-associated protein Csm1 [Methanomicrobium sp. W14]
MKKRLSTVDETEINRIVTAALFHDIGKFSQRAGEGLTGKYEAFNEEKYGKNGAHAKWSAQFINQYFPDVIVEDLVLCHHNPAASASKNYAKIIQDADRLSSAMDRRERKDKEKGDVRKEPLKSIFPSIGKKNETGTDNAMYYPVSELDLSENIFPKSLDEIKRYNYTFREQYKRLWKGFTEQCRNLDKKPDVGTTLALLKRYTSKIPSAVYVNDPDIPLFDHSKTTAAIAHALAASSDKTRPYLLIQGDISGIQDFIFNVVTPEDARKKMAKRLRGRSFWLVLFSDAIVTEICRELTLTPVSVLWDTGGKFVILAPNTPENRDMVEKLAAKVNRELLQKFGGRIYLATGLVDAGKDDIREFQTTLRRLTEEVAKKKSQKFLDCGIRFEPVGQNASIKKFCPVCGSLLDDQDHCRSCLVHDYIGTKIAGSEYLVRRRDASLPVSYRDYGLNVSYDLIKAEKKVYDSNTDVFSLNSTDFTVKGKGERGFRFIGNTVPKYNKEILTFSDIAKLSKGAPKLGILKADVDNLGKLFAFGIPENDRSISRIHTFSDQLQLFFAGYLNRICEEFCVYHDLCSECAEKFRNDIIKITREREDGGKPQKFEFYRLSKDEKPCEKCLGKKIPAVYITYSGGDDLLIIAPWDIALELAGKIYSEFRRFTCENPVITLSAGVEITSPRLPISRGVAYADMRLENAKENGKNRISVFDECLIWKDEELTSHEKSYFRVIETARDLEDAVCLNKVSRGMIYSFLRLWNQTWGDTTKTGCTFENAMNARVNRKRFVPHLKYMMKRNIRDTAVRSEVEKLISPDMFGWIKLPVYWTSLRMRKREEM